MAIEMSAKPINPLRIIHGPLKSHSRVLKGSRTPG